MFPEAAKKLIIEYKKNIKVVNPKPYFNGGNPKPKPTLGKPNPKPQQAHLHENDHPPDNPRSEDSTQAMVHECLADGGIDPSDFGQEQKILSTFFKENQSSPKICLC